jgi:hypothetical protein
MMRREKKKTHGDGSGRRQRRFDFEVGEFRQKQFLEKSIRTAFDNRKKAEAEQERRDGHRTRGKEEGKDSSPVR